MTLSLHCIPFYCCGEVGGGLENQVVVSKPRLKTRFHTNENCCEQKKKKFCKNKRENCAHVRIQAPKRYCLSKQNCQEWTLNWTFVLIPKFKTIYNLKTCCAETFCSVYFQKIIRSAWLYTSAVAPPTYANTLDVGGSGHCVSFFRQIFL